LIAPATDGTTGSGAAGGTVDCGIGIIGLGGPRRRAAPPWGARGARGGDRHLDNLLVDQGTGELVPIDFGRSFGMATEVRPMGGGEWEWGGQWRRTGRRSIVGGHS